MDTVLLWTLDEAPQSGGALHHQPLSAAYIPGRNRRSSRCGSVTQPRLSAVAVGRVRLAGREEAAKFIVVV